MMVCRRRSAINLGLTYMISKAQDLWKTLQPHLEPYYRAAEREFNTRTSDFNFVLFCLLYSILFVFLVRCCTPRQRRWRPRNKELKTTGEKLKESFYSTLFSLPLLKGFINRKFQQSLQKEEVGILESLHKHWDHRKVSALPVDGMTEDHLRKRIMEWKEKERKIWDTGKVSGAFYVTEEEHQDEMSKFAGVYLYHNPLHLDTYKELIKMEKEVLNMTNSLITDVKDPKEYHGVITSGGSESLILALYAYRNYYKNRTRPNIVIPVTAHAAIDKGCFYMNIEARKVRLAANYQVDMKHLKQLVDSNTILIIGSAPNYPHGICDPIAEMAAFAKKKNIGFHVDGCLGGFVGTFSNDHKHLYSLDQEGVTSVSLDHHKFALAPKGISTIFFKTRELRHHAYYINMDWKGGLYGTMSFPGSRPGFASAAAWYSMTQITKKGFKRNAEIVIDATRQGAKRLRKVEGIEVFGEPDLCVIAFCPNPNNGKHLQLTDYLKHEKKWNISSIHKPYGIHISVTIANADNVKNHLSKDVKDGLEYIKKQQAAKGADAPKASMESELYGTTTKIPTNGMETDVLRLLMGASMK